MVFLGSQFNAFCFQWGFATLAGPQSPCLKTLCDLISLFSFQSPSSRIHRGGPCACASQFLGQDPEDSPCGFLDLLKQNDALAAAGVAQFVGSHPAKQKVTSSIPRLSTDWVVSSVPGPGTCRRQLIDVSLTHWCFSPSLSLSSPLSLKRKRRRRS